jgi:hypothetical protein
MKRSTTAVIVGVLALGLVGGGTAMALSNSGEPAPEASTSAPAPVVSDAPAEAATDVPATPAPADSGQTSEADARFLKYVADEKPPISLLDGYTDAALIERGHEACVQAEASVPWEDIRLVDDEEPTSAGYYLDTSAILNGALYNYCPELIPDVEPEN